MFSDRQWWEQHSKESLELHDIEIALMRIFDSRPDTTCCCGAPGENLVDWAGWRPCYSEGSWSNLEWLCTTCYDWLMRAFDRG